MYKTKVLAVLSRRLKGASALLVLEPPLFVK